MDVNIARIEFISMFLGGFKWNLYEKIHITTLWFELLKKYKNILCFSLDAIDEEWLDVCGWGNFN